MVRDATRLLGFQEVTSGGRGDGGPAAGPRRRAAPGLSHLREDRGAGVGARIGRVGRSAPRGAGFPEAPRRGSPRAAGAGGPGVALGRGLSRPAPGAAVGSAAAGLAFAFCKSSKMKNRSQPRRPLRRVGNFPASLRFLEPQGRTPLESIVLRVAAGGPRPGSHLQPS